MAYAGRTVQSSDVEDGTLRPVLAVSTFYRAVNDAAIAETVEDYLWDGLALIYVSGEYDVIEPT